MKILFSHIKEYFKDDTDIESVSNSLFKLGHENEIENDIIDIEFTPNKGDCLSVYGLARDLNTIHDVDFSMSIYKDRIDELDFDFKNEEKDFCPKISFLKIEVENTTSKYKPYIEDYFSKLNIAKNNFFTDISNYLAYELGQPTHCYDFNKLKGGINLTSIKENLSFRTLHGKDIELTSGEKVFKSNNEIINLAGVMGGYNSKCDALSNNVLIECAFFNPDMIIGKSIKYDLVSDAAYKFERGTDINMHDFALRRFIYIVQEHVKIKSVEIKSESLQLYKNKRISRDYARINNILGVDLKNNYIDSILSKLGFNIDDYFEVPSWRTDIDTINDLAEEIARVIGYDQIQISNFSISKKLTSNSSNSNSKSNRIRNYLVSQGFNEIINDPFVANGKTESIKVDNPLDSKRSFLRLDLINSLMKNLDYNEKRQKEIIKFFEISDVYFTNKDEEVIYKKKLSIIISGRQGLNYLDFNKKLDRGYLKKIIHNLGLDEEHVIELDRALLNSKIKNKIYYIECEIDAIDDTTLNKNKIKETQYFFKKSMPVSEFPASQRDISISLANEEALKKVTRLIYGSNILNIKDFFIFDFYHNKDKNILKVGFRFIFQSYYKTLKESEVDKEMQKIFNSLIKIDGVNIPGL